MPVVRVEYDNAKLDQQLMTMFCEAIREIVIQSTGIAEVCVYANNSQIKIQVNPIEVFVEISAHKVTDLELLMQDTVDLLKQRKQTNNFTTPIVLTITPMHWKFEVDI